jgi:hypothetical protein
MLASRRGAPPMRSSQQPRASSAQAPPGSALQSASLEHVAGMQSRPGYNPAGEQKPPLQSASLSHSSTTHTFWESKPAVDEHWTGCVVTVKHWPLLHSAPEQHSLAGEFNWHSVTVSIGLWQTPGPSPKRKQEAGGSSAGQSLLALQPGSGVNDRVPAVPAV